MSAFKGVCHLPGDRGFSLLVTRELEPRRTDSVNKGTAAREAAAAAPAAVCGPLAGAPAGVAGSPGGGAGGCALSRPNPPLLLGPGPLWVGAPWTEFRCISEREPDMEPGAGTRGDEAPRLGSLSPASSPLVTQAACVCRDLTRRPSPGFASRVGQGTFSRQEGIVGLMNGGAGGAGGRPARGRRPWSSPGAGTEHSAPTAGLARGRFRESRRVCGSLSREGKKMTERRERMD